MFWTTRADHSTPTQTQSDEPGADRRGKRCNATQCRAIRPSSRPHATAFHALIKIKVDVAH
ncbi:hypothetical protein D1O30_06350 [Methylocystis hirsuta]|uniref:Uncharacterized protein n=1 Tax=Methylocystis hirsuta TaxID=369798 RepID=A0A3M9XN70_9HYPH|nr:hypothetical protein D1O30_06350 [Methylocystis hirsuta]